MESDLYIFCTFVLKLTFMDFSHSLALKLLQIKAIQINLQNLFVWSSGIQSPIYCDNRIALSYPEARKFIVNGFINLLNEVESVDVVAGVATAGIPWGSMIAYEMNKPFVYVRAESKSHGKMNKIEGQLSEGKKIIVIEDLISTGGSSIKAVDALREKKCEVISVLSIFQYNLPAAEVNFKKINCSFKSLSNFDALILEAQNQNYITSREFEHISEWKIDPENWFKN